MTAKLSPIKFVSLFGILSLDIFIMMRVNLHCLSKRERKRKRKSKRELVGERENAQI